MNNNKYDYLIHMLVGEILPPDFLYTKLFNIKIFGGSLINSRNNFHETFVYNIVHRIRINIRIRKTVPFIFLFMIKDCCLGLWFLFIIKHFPSVYGTLINTENIQKPKITQKDSRIEKEAIKASIAPHVRSSWKLCASIY